ncbi:MAG: diguanylate cyclase [Gammaproteobacteria bacterium]|nr:diguanylate cyclase [Gammaproteobacteria bacterium]
MRPQLFAFALGFNLFINTNFKVLITIWILIFTGFSQRVYASSDSLTAASLLAESTQPGISHEQRLGTLQRAKKLAQQEGDIYSTGNALYEICVVYLEQGDNEQYLIQRRSFNDYFEQYKDNTTALLLKLLDIEHNLRNSNHNEAVLNGEALVKQIRSDDLTRRSRLNDSIYEFTLSDLARLSNFLGIAYFSLGQYEFSQAYFSDSMKYNMELGNQSVVASLLGNLSAVSWSQNDFEKALDYTEQAISILETTEATQTLLRNILNKGVYLVELERPVEAQAIFFDLIQDNNIGSYPDIKISALYNLASSLIESEKFDQAERHLIEAMELSVNLKDEMSINDVNQQLAQLKIAKKDYRAAIPLLKENARYYESKGLKRDMAETYKILSGAYRNLKQYEDALDYLEPYYSLMLELQNESRQKSITEFQEKFDAEQRENEIAALKSQNAIHQLQVESKNNLIKALVAIGVLVILMIWNQLRNKQKLADQFETMSLTDPLTKIGNRRYFKAHINRELEYAKRHMNSNSQQGLGIFIFDIDFFKKLNDRYGHDAGDTVLIEFSQRIKTTLRSSDLLARWGGEEFVVAARINSQKDLPLIASKILTIINGSPFELVGSDPIAVSCSIGGVAYPFINDNDVIPDWHLLINLADHALYEAKQKGRNQWVLVENNNIQDFNELEQSGNETLDDLIKTDRIRLASSSA